MNKYGNEKTMRNGMLFDGKKEAGPFPGWPAYGYRDEEDYLTQMRAVIAKLREDAP